MRWTIKEINFLKENYKLYSIVELMHILNKSKASITNKASKLYLTYSKHINYDIDYLKNEIQKYKSKKELLYKNWRIYNYLRQNNLLYLCEYSKSYSIPQLVLKEILEILFGNCL